MQLTPELISVRPAEAGDMEFLAEFALAEAQESRNLLLLKRTVREGITAALLAPDRIRYFVAEYEEAIPVAAMTVRVDFNDWYNTASWTIIGGYEPDNVRNQHLFSILIREVIKAAAVENVLELKADIPCGHEALLQAATSAEFTRRTASTALDASKDWQSCANSE